MWYALGAKGTIFWWVWTRIVRVNGFGGIIVWNAGWCFLRVKILGGKVDGWRWTDAVAFVFSILEKGSYYLDSLCFLQW